MPVPYTSQTITDYNTSPPPDDGSATSANTVKWATHKDKLADPIKTLAEAINTETLAAFGKVMGTTFEVKSANYTVTASDQGKIIYSDTAGITFSLPAVATAGTGFPLVLANFSAYGFGSGNVTIDPDGSEVIIVQGHLAGATTLTLRPGQWAYLTCNGTNWIAVISEEREQHKVKGTAESKSSTTTYADDNVLAGFEILAGESYSVEAYLHWYQNGGDFKAQFTIDQTPQDSSAFVRRRGSGEGSSFYDDLFTGSIVLVTSFTDNEDACAVIHGGVQGHASNDATMDLQWAPATSNANATVLARDCWVKVTKG